MSEQKWLTNTGGSWRGESSMNSKVVLTVSQANGLATSTYNISTTSLLFGDYSKWCSSLMYYPMQLKDPEGAVYKLSGGGVSYDCDNLGLLDVNTEFGFYMGQYYVTSASSFMDFEPYTKLEVFLPYYGFVPVKIADVSGKYMQFRLYVDFNTGQAMYVIGVNSSLLTVPNAPYVTGIDDTDTRILSTHTFQLGVNVPVGSSNFNDTVRNTVSSVAAMALSFAGSSLGERVPTTSTTDTLGRNITKSQTSHNDFRGKPSVIYSDSAMTREGSSSTKTYTYNGGSRVNSAINGLGTVLDSVNISPKGVGSSNGSLENNLSPSICIVTTKAIPLFDPYNDTQFKKLVGIPCGKCAYLSELSGYTTISNIRLESDRFSYATYDELAQIEHLLSNGVIL